jgi:two-component system cell cycle sensor histidine kinase/response regulator CckA
VNGEGTILAVDDTPESLALLVRILGAAGYVVRPADSSELALAAVAASQPDLILLDVRMKGMGGLDLCRRLKASKKTSQIPIILISAFAEVKEWVEGLRLGAADYITKPFQTEELLSRVATQLSVRRANVALEVHEAALYQTNTLLNAEIVGRQRIEDELRRSLVRAERSRLAMLSTLEDQKRTENALRENEARLRDITFSMGDWVWETDEHGVYTFSSEKGVDYFGLTRKDVIGKTPFDFMTPDDAKRLPAVFLDIAARKAPIKDLENWNIKKNGERICLLTNGVPILDDAGNLKGYRGVDKDITEHKRADEEKRNLEARLQQAEKMESVGRLAGGVAHDFNNMLAVILGYSELALRQSDPAEPLHADLTEIHKAATRSADLTGQLLAFARRQTVAPKVLDLNETVAGMLNMLRPLIGENIDIKWEPAEGLWPVKVDPSQIDQILANLCVNARDAISGVGTLTIEMGNCRFDDQYCAANQWCAPGDFVRIALSDTGCGMDKDTLSHLFEPFFTTKVMGKGTGLGLATVYGIVKQNDGFLNVYSEPNLGTRFTVYLPRHVGNAAQAQSEVEARPSARGRETILLVEDEPAILMLTRRMLEHQGYTVLASSAPADAIRMAKEHSGEINLLMTDVVMPEMNGRILARNLRSVYPLVKRLFMSGYTADVIARHGVLDEGVHFIQKPFSQGDLAAKVRDALDAPV